MNLDYRYLRAFILTAKHANFSRAAKDLHIAQSAVSRQIKLLEESLGCQLLVRSPQKVLLTEKGQRLFDRASNFEEWSSQEFANHPTNIRVGTLPGLLDTFLVPRVARFCRAESLNFFLRADSQPVIVEMLRRSELDACIVHAPVEIPGVVSSKLLTEDIYVVSKSPVDMERLEQYRWIHMGTAQFLRRFSKKVSSRQIVVNSMHAIIDLVSAGLGIAAVPDYVVDKKKHLKLYKLNFKGQIYLAHWEYAIWPAHMKEFFESLAGDEK